MDMAVTDNQLSDMQSQALKLEGEIKKVIVGQDKSPTANLDRFFCSWHVLLNISYKHLRNGYETN